MCRRLLRPLNFCPESLDDVCLLHQHEKQLHDDEKELGDIRDTLLGESDEVYAIQARMVKELFKCLLKIKKLLLSSSHSPNTSK